MAKVAAEVEVTDLSKVGKSSDRREPRCSTGVWHPNCTYLRKNDFFFTTLNLTLGNFNSQHHGSINIGGGGGGFGSGQFGGGVGG